MSEHRLSRIYQTPRSRPPTTAHATGIATHVQADRSIGWRSFSAVCCASAAGFLVVAIANTLARLEFAVAEWVFLLGLAMLFVPPAVRLTAAAPTRAERLWLVVLLGLLSYGVKVLHSPIRFTFFDEFSHWRTVIDIMRFGELFHVNPLQQISAFYPGLEIATAAFASMSGLPVYPCGLLLLAVARVVLMLGLFLFYEYITGSERIAGIAGLLYVANPNFLFFDAQFSYESLALPFFALLLWALARRQDTQGMDRVALTLVLLCGLGALMLTHHVSTYAFIGLLLVWQFAVWLVHHKRNTSQGLGQTPLIAAILGITWMAFVALLTVDYLAPHFINGVVELAHMIAGESEPRQLFRARSGATAPFWERGLSFGAVLLILFVLPWGLWRVWRSYRSHGPVLALGFIALLYPGTLALRLTERGSETANRASEFLFLGIALVLAIAVVELWLARRHRGTVALWTGWATVLFIGGMLVGFARWARLPGPYIVAADTRSVEREGVEAARWASARLGPDNRVTADRINRMLMGTYGLQRTVTGYGDQFDIWVPYFAPELSERVRQVWVDGNIQYVVADLRLTTMVPTASGYFERGERYYRYRTTPMQPEMLAKFDRDETISRVFDSGNIRIYDVGATAND
jgi:hypothetical protein